MRQLGFRAKLTMWYAFVLIILINAFCGAAYIAVYLILTTNSNKTIQEWADIIAQSVVFEDGSIYFELSDADSSSIGGQYALYDASGIWRDGNNPQISSVEAILEHPEQAHSEHDQQLIYDKPIYDANHGFIGTIRVLMPHTTQIILMKLRMLWGILFLPSVVISFLIGRLVASKAIKPIKSMTKAAIEIGAGDLSKRIQINGQRDELGELAHALNEMADHVEQAFNREKQFTSDASHEMRTPVAVIIANAEDAKNDDSLETYRKTNAIILEKSRQLQKMLTQLLMLTRASQQAELMEMETINLCKVINNLAEEGKIWAEEKNITIKTNLEQNLYIEADLMLFTRMMVNLIYNAVKYGRQGGDVTIKSERQGKNAFISVCDNGIGIAEKDLPHLFKRFYKADESRTGESAGLGLSFADMIAQLHKGKITATSKLGEGACFIVELPATNPR